jgi:hypothetical protein
MTINFNQSPYFDDFNEDKKFQRVLFRPGRPVQARELTQLQTILQNQISRFGSHIFKEGSVVLDGNFSIENDVAYVKIRDLDSSGNAYDLTSLENQIITGATTGIQAYVIKTATGLESSTDTKTLMVRYLSSASNGSIETFNDNEVLTANSANVRSLTTNSTGTGSLFSIESGVVFAKDHFIKFDKQTVILNRYSTTPTCKVGFLIDEFIIDFIDDASLLDNAQGSPNFSAPGADRLKLSPTLTVVDFESTFSLPDFVELFSIKNGELQTLFENPQYNVIKNELAKRTYDESGDYVVNGMDVRVRENLNVANNEGLLTLAEGGDGNLLSIGVEPGLAYVKGFEVAPLITSYISTDKSLDFQEINSQITPARIGNYVVLEEVTGSFPLDSGTTIKLYDTAQQRLTNEAWSTGAQTGSEIGTAKLKTVQYESQTLGTPTGKIRLYLYDIRMSANQSFANTRSVFLDNSTTADVGGDVVLTSNNALLQDTTTSLLFPVGASDVRRIKSSTGLSDTTFTFNKTQNVTVSSGGTFSVSISTLGEAFPYGTSPVDIGTTERREILLSFNENKSITLAGTVANTTSNTITGTSTAFEFLNVGDKIEVANVSGTFYIASIGSNTALTIEGTFPSLFTGETISKVYKNGDIIDLTTKGSTAGETRTVSPSGGGSTALVFDLKETFTGTTSATVTTKVTRSSANQINKTLRPSRFVKIDCSDAANVSLTGPISLGVADVFEIKQIRLDTTAFTTSTQGTDVTSSFVLDTGQRDEIYDHASITPNGITLTTSSNLLVEFDYFEPDFSQGVGYFSVDSYPVNDVAQSSTTIFTYEIPKFRSETTGTSYDLRNFLDFRPVKTSTASDSTTVAGATTNPAISNGIILDANGQRLPVPSSQILIDFSFYLSRIDVVVVDEFKNFSIIEGTSAEDPVMPAISDNFMALAVIFVAPYPSLSPALGRRLNRSDISCKVKRVVTQRFTMRQIGALKRRIQNLEYYASINTLEKNALDMLIPDENGLDRFKNGIFVDNFKNHTLGATYNPDYSIVVDAAENSIRPKYKMDSILYEYNSSGSSNIVEHNVQPNGYDSLPEDIQKRYRSGKVIMLPYTEETLLAQNRASTIRNVETSVYKFNGRLQLFPDNDVWVATEDLETNIVDIGGNSVDPAFEANLGNNWNAWEEVVVGYGIFAAGSSDPIGGKYFKTEQEARSLSSQLAGPAQVKSAAVRDKLGYTGPNIGTTVELVTQRTRSGAEVYTAEGEKQEIQLGNFVKNVDIVPYIRAQEIRLFARGMKANTTFYTFFDGKNMSSFVTPADDEFVLTGSEGDNLISNANGEVYGILRLPKKNANNSNDDSTEFRTGTKQIVVTNSPTNDPEATSACDQFFVAQGLIQQKQNTVITTRQVVVVQNPIEDRETSRRVVHSQPWRRSSCLAYSFYLGADQVPENEEGAFLTSVDLYFQAKDPTLGIWFEIREMDNSGGITRTQVPLSEVWLRSSDVNTSSDGSVATKVTFPVPIFLQNRTQYAFVLHTEGINPNYYVWVSKLGENDVITNQSITERPRTGTLFTTNNDLNYIPVDRTDLKVRFNRAKFNTSVSGSASFGNKPIEILRVNSANVLSSFGETFQGQVQVTLTDIVGGSVDVGNRIQGQTSNANSEILAISGTTYRTDNLTVPVLQAGETANVLFANGISKGVTATISTATRAEGSLYSYLSESSGNAIIELIESNGIFYVGDVLIGSQSSQTANVSAFETVPYSLFHFDPDFLVFNNTTCSYQASTLDNNNVVRTLGSVNVRGNNQLNSERKLISRTLENSLLSGQASKRFTATLTTASEYVSPIIDTARSHSVFVHNLVNTDTTGETNSSGGNLINKYISRTITLADGQDAEELNVFITAYRPPGTDVKIYFKSKNANDRGFFESELWIEMENVSSDLVSSLANTNDFKSYDFKIPDSYMTGPNGEFQYTFDGVTYTGFKQFSIKIGLTSNNSAVIPRVGDLRAIALQL